MRIRVTELHVIWLPAGKKMETDMITSDREGITPTEVALNDFWFPQIVGQVNGQLVKVAKLKGQNVWRKHAEDDEMFSFVSGSLEMEYEDRAIGLN